MAQPFIQASFNSGEWAPHLYARTDLEKFHSGAALLRNWFVDYRGGASTRSSTKYILRGYKDSTAIRLIPFQASISLGFALEFGDQYIRFHRNGAPVLETGLSITGATKAATCQLTVTNTYTTGDVDWVYISGVGGMTELNGKYYIVHARTNTTVDLYDLFGNPVDSTGYTTYTSGGTTQRIYTIASPYAAADLALLKFTENVDVMIICHPSYVPYALTYTSAASWAIAAITFGTTVTTPTNTRASSTLGGGSTYYSYVVTAVDSNGQESAISTAATLSALTDLRTVAGTNTVTWDPVAGASSYNIYKSDVSYNNPVPTGTFYGFIGNVTSVSIADSNITPDFSQPPPVVQNPFSTGHEVTSATVGTAGSYTTAPTVTFSAPAGGGTTATGTPLLSIISATVSAGGASTYNVGDTITLTDSIVLTVATLAGAAPNAVATVTITNAGTAATLPANPVSQSSSSGSGTGATFTLAWGVASLVITNGGTGYEDPTDIPTITFSAGAAAATAILGLASNGNPSVPTFFQQRLVLAGPATLPSAFNMSQPGFYYNFNTTNPVQDDDAIAGTIVTGQLANIKALIAQPGGLITFTDGISYLINGGSLGAAVTPSALVANPQSFLGCNDMPPIVVNFDILNVQSKGSSVRDSTYNFYANVFTGADISILSSHLFFGYQLTEWAWAEEPYKIVWAIRNDGTMLSLTFIKEQEFTAWTHHVSEAGSASFKSVCSIVESASVGYQNYVYTVVQRSVRSTTVQYIEYMPERPVSDSAQDYWTVDCAISYSGAPATTFQGAEFLGGKTVTGLADGTPITPFVMPTNGTFTLSPAASNVKVGLAMTCDLQTLYIDLGNPTIQSKEKKINGVALRVTQTLGLKVGSDSSNLVAMKDLVIGNVGRMTNELVAGLVTGDAFTYIDPKWQEQGQVYVRQDQPYPASILGFIPQVAVGDTK